MNAAAIYNPTTTGEHVEVSYDPHRFRNSARTKRKYLMVLSVLLILIGGAFLLYGAVFYSSLSSHIATKNEHELHPHNSSHPSSSVTEPSWLHHSSTTTARSVTLYAIFVGLATVMCAIGVAIWWHLRCRSVIDRRGRCYGDCWPFARFWRHLTPGMATNVEKLSGSQQQLHLLEAGNLPVSAPVVDDELLSAAPTAASAAERDTETAGGERDAAGDKETDAMVLDRKH